MRQRLLYLIKVYLLTVLIFIAAKVASDAFMSVLRING